MKILFEVTTILAFTLLAIIVPFFVFATTLFGSAIKRVKAEEEEAREEDEIDFQKGTRELEAQIEEARKSGSTKALEERLKELKKNKQKFNKQLKSIQSKYDTIRFKGLVVYPGFFLILTIILSSGAKIYFDSSLHLATWLWIFSLLFIGVGIRRLCISLLTIQETSISSDELRIREQAEAFTKALERHEEVRAERLNITFIRTAFPYKCKVSTELTLNFRINLTQGKIVKNVAVWFFVPDGFDIVKPNYFWRQSEDFKRAPNIRTVKIRIGDLSIGPYTPSSFTIKTPAQPGKYTFLHSLMGDGYDGPIEEVIFEVEE